MGLPLFIAPVESDLPSKAADKTSSTSPSRSNIRRHGRTASRERRAALRRHMSIRDRVTMPMVRPSAMGSSSRLADPLLDDGFEPSRIQRARPFREVMREMARSDDRNRERFEEQLHSLFTATPPRERGSGDSGAEDTAPSQRTEESALPAYLRARYAATSAELQEAGAESRPRSRRRAPPPANHPDAIGAAPSMPIGPSQLRRSSHTRMLPSFSALIGGAERLGETARNRDVNGLGDRERSLSPEVWDTLLTTLTPDPQGPSAGSSFASTVASQNAGASSGTALTTPDLAGPVDQACESGCENSDEEDANIIASAPNRRRREENRREQGRRVRMRIPDYNLDGSVDGPLVGPTDGPFSRHGPSSSDTERRSLARPTRLNSLTERTQQDRDDTMRGITRGENMSFPNAPPRDPQHPRVVRDSRYPRDPREPREPREPQPTREAIPHYERFQSGWIGHLYIGGPDELPPPDWAPRRPYRELPAGTALIEAQDEEDWQGMRHIVRSLARREDIPDEWWAEVGLSRNLPGTD